MQIKPMLAIPSKDVARTPVETVERLDLTREWYFDVKWDGVRCIAHCDHGTVKLINRQGRDITFRYPEVVAALAERFARESAVLDGELLVFGADGRPDFSRVHRRDAQTTERGVSMVASQHPATFMVFDLLAQGGDDLRQVPLLARRELLAALALDALAPRLLTSRMGEDGPALWTFVLTHDLEGLIAKKRLSTYHGGRRSPEWVKVKQEHTLSAVVTGYQEGQGSRAGKVGALLLALHGPDGLVPIGKVGTGFNARSLTEAARRLAAGQPFIVEVAYHQVTADGQLRFPSFRGFRTDVDTAACDVAQLER